MLLHFFIINSELLHVPIVYVNRPSNQMIQPTYYKVYYEGRKLDNFCICIPFCLKKNEIIYQEAFYD
jgi:hypothetical protein